jgi:hypothetical protein
MNKKYRIFIIFHDTLNINYYNDSILRNLVFINVRKDNKNKYPDFKILNLHDFKDFVSIGRFYAESEVLYNVSKNRYLIEDVNYIGFLHHDIDCSTLTNELIVEMITNNEFLSFETHQFTTDYNRKILMDSKKPNVLYGKGLNCYDVIFSDFNSFYNTNFCVSAYYNKEQQIMLCSCFLVNKELFLELMKFGCHIIESGKLNMFDTKHKYRIQGGFMERYYATWFLLKNIPFVSFKLQHYFHETEKQNTLTNRIIRKIKSYF